PTGPWVPVTLLNPYKANVWYALSIWLDDASGFRLEVHERDNPQVSATYKSAVLTTGMTWHFGEYLYNAVNAYTDNYRESMGGSIGQRTRMLDNSGSTTDYFDRRGRVITEAKTITGTGTYTTSTSYDASDRMRTL